MNTLSKGTIIAVLLVAILIFGGIAAYADTFPSPEPFEIWSEDETMVFRWTLIENREAQARFYRSGELIYTIDKLPSRGVTARNFIFSQDFRHFMFMPTTGFEVALEFYSNGELVKTHYIRELVRNMNNVSQTVTMAMWRTWLPNAEPPTDSIAENDVLRIMTIENVMYEFDLTTGAILYRSGNSSVSLRNSAIIVGGVVIVGVIVLLLLKRRNRHHS